MSQKKLELEVNFGFHESDIGVALNSILTQRYGEKALFGIDKYTRKSRPLAYRETKISCQDSAKALVGKIKIQHERLMAYLEIAGSDIIFEFGKNYQKEIEDIIASTRNYLKSKSIYKGQAVNINGEFLDLSSVDYDSVVYNKDVFSDLNSNLWSLIENAGECKECGIKIQRKILLTGPYGCGKTLTALYTAKKAVGSGFTFIYMPARGSSAAIKFALVLMNMYAPAVGFIEDIDCEQGSRDSGSLLEVLEAIDGIMSKGKEFILVMSTNHAEKLDGGMIRPGRVDRIVPLHRMDYTDIQRMISRPSNNCVVDKNINWRNIGEVCQGYTQAFIEEMRTGSVLEAITCKDYVITEQRLLKAAKDLRWQFEQCEKSLKRVGFVGNGATKNGHDNEPDDVLSSAGFGEY